MAGPPPRKRQKRLVVSSSSEDEEGDACRDDITGNGDHTTVDPCTGLEIISSASLTAKTTRRGTVRDQKKRSQRAPSSTTSSFLSTASTTSNTRSRTQTRKQTTLPVLLSPQGSRTAAAPRSILPSSSPASSPEKCKPRARKTADNGNGSSKATTGNKDTRSVRTFFQPATEQQRWDRTERARSVTSTGTGTKAAEDQQAASWWEGGDDLIEDDGIDEIFENLARNGHGNGTVNGQAAGWMGGNGAPVKPRADRSSIAGGKKFVLPTSAVAGSTLGSVTSNGGPMSQETSPSGKPWAEEFAPVDLEELAVHKKKVADVQNWLVGVFSGKSRQRLLVLRGPAGSGKTTTVSLLSKALGYDIVEWKNSSGPEYSMQGYPSRGAQFDDFLGRTDKFSTLEMEDGLNRQQLSQAEARRVILVEEFPSSLSPGSSGLTAFRSALQQYLATAVPSFGIGRRLMGASPLSSPPVIIIVSETLLGNGSSLLDNFTVHRLLGPEISNHPGVTIIEFNRVATTFVSKALDLVLKKEARRSKRKRVPGPAVLKRISEMGDIRSAISSLEFLCLRGDDSGGNQGWSGTLASRLKKSSKTGVVPTAMEKESLEMVTQREASLGIFHAVGKVVYNKREDPAIRSTAEAARLSQPPQHLPEHARPKESQVSVEELINETGTDVQTFIAALHENYALSCSGSDSPENMEACISWLSDSDILGPESRQGYRASRGGIGSARSSLQSYGSVDVLRQEEMAFQVAVRGLLFSLPYPVKRQAVPGGRALDAHKMFYPTSMRLWRENEEIEGLLDMWIRRLTTSSSALPVGDSGSRTSRPGGVESWKNPFSLSVPSKDDAETSHLPPRTMMSREEVLLERLPYTSRILKDASDLNQLERITKFRGIMPPTDEPGDDDMLGLDGSPAEPWTTDRPPSTPKKRRLQSVVSDVEVGIEAVEEVVDKLVLSDDDIED